VTGVWLFWFARLHVYEHYAEPVCELVYGSGFVQWREDNEGRTVLLVAPPLLLDVRPL
jgi:hypothetical protein